LVRYGAQGNPAVVLGASEERAPRAGVSAFVRPGDEETSARPAEAVSIFTGGGGGPRAHIFIGPLGPPGREELSW